MDINYLYMKEKIINSYFKQKYDYNNEEIFNKQVLELICELSELAYETKCFKYWKNEAQSPADITIAELADCLMLALCFCDLSNIEKLELVNVLEEDMVKLFIETNALASQLTIDIDKKIVLRILSNLLKIASMLNYTDEELELNCLNKMDKTLKMVKGESE